MTEDTLIRTFEKRFLIASIGGGDIPVDWRWESMRFLRNNDGSDAEQPRLVYVPATAEEVAVYVGEAFTALQADLQAVVAQRNTFRDERDALQAQLNALRGG